MRKLDTSKTTRWLKYDFNEEEKRRLGADLSEAKLAEDDAKKKKASVAAQIGAEIKAADMRTCSLAEKLRSGYEYRDIPCEIEKDYNKGIVRIVRIDFGEIVEERKITDADSQQTFA